MLFTPEVKTPKNTRIPKPLTEQEIQKKLYGLRPSQHPNPGLGKYWVNSV